MTIHSRLLCCIVPMLLFGVGCKKSAEPAPANTAQPAPATTAQPASPPAASPEPAAASGADTGAATIESAAKMSAVDWALKQDEIKNDANGQWAIQATSSSAYGDAKGTASYSANQATGVPNVDKYGDNGSAWTAKTADAGIEWLDLQYPRPVHATTVRVRESCGSGSVIKVELFDEQGTAHTAWAGNDPTQDLNYLVVKFPKTAFKTARVKITLATNVVPSWNEVDAVQLVGIDQ
jgi:hypothetical protein